MSNNECGTETVPYDRQLVIMLSRLKIEIIGLLNCYFIHNNEKVLPGIG